jgi:hypothetical protein
MNVESRLGFLKVESRIVVTRDWGIVGEKGMKRG